MVNFLSMFCPELQKLLKPIKLHIGQGRAGLKRKRSGPINEILKQPSELSQKIPGKTKIETGKTNQVHSKDTMHIINNVDVGMTHTNPFTPDISFSNLQTPSQNLLDQMCQEVRKVHKVHQV